MQSIPGRSGDWASSDSTYNSSETPVNVVIHKPRRYDDWEQLKGDIENWLFGDEDWLSFGKTSDYLYRAQIVTAPTFTPVNFERVNATFTFHFHINMQIMGFTGKNFLEMGSSTITKVKT